MIGFHETSIEQLAVEDPQQVFPLFVSHRLALRVLGVAICVAHQDSRPPPGSQHSARETSPPRTQLA